MSMIVGTVAVRISVASMAAVRAVAEITSGASMGTVTEMMAVVMTTMTIMNNTTLVTSMKTTVTILMAMTTTVTTEMAVMATVGSISIVVLNMAVMMTVVMDMLNMAVVMIAMIASMMATIRVGVNMTSIGVFVEQFESINFTPVDVVDAIIVHVSQDSLKTTPKVSFSNVSLAFLSSVTLKVCAVLLEKTV